MLGWITIFALMFLLGLAALAGFFASSHPDSSAIVTVVSGTLLTACVLTRVARGGF
jgi:hypothetical protein